MRRWIAAGAVMLAACASSVARADTSYTFHYTGAEQTLAIPAGVTSVSVTAVGGMGAPEPAVPPLVFGGYGAVVSGTVPVQPDSTLYVEVGGNGDYIDGGFNGGGWSEGVGAGGGGGASDVQTQACPVATNCAAAGSAGALLLSRLSRLLVAAGGGGAGYLGASVDDAGAGGDAGQPGGAGGGNDDSGGEGGGAGTATAGGAGGEAGSGSEASGAASSGTLGGGGTWNAEGPAPGGGGGGGLYGGGAGGSGNVCTVGYCAGGGGGGGGGSSLIPPGGTFAVDTTGVPMVEVTVPTPLPAPVAEQSPSVAGVPFVGDALACKPGTWTESPFLAFEWLRDGAPVAAGSSYTTTAADVGAQLVCAVTATSAGESSTADSEPVTISPAIPAPSPQPSPGTGSAASSQSDTQPVSGSRSEAAARIKAALRALVATAERRCTVRALKRRHGCVLTLADELPAGRVVLTWRHVRSVVARAAASSTPSHRITFRFVLTRRGRRMLHGHGRLTVTLSVRLVRPGESIAVSRVLRLR